MKIPFIVLLMLITSAIQAATYYVSSSGSSSNTGLSTSSTWNLATVNSFTFSPGDQILLKRGDTFQGNIVLTESGTLANPIIIGAYGTGEKPTLTGLVSITSWTNLGSNIWESTNSVSSQPTLDMVTINGVNTAMGRFPNSSTRDQGYLTYQKHNSTTSITSSGLSGTLDWTGAEVVVKINLWTLRKSTITSQSGGEINFGTLGSRQTPTDRYGFFIQNDPRTLDKQGEWYFSPSTKKLKMYSKSQPSGVKVCADDTLILISGNYVTIDNLNITGSNTKGIYVFKSNATPNHITIQNCDISYSGGTAIYCRGNHISVIGNTITTSNKCAIDADQCRISSIRNNTIKDTSLLFEPTRQAAIMAESSVTSTVIEYNRIINSGMNGINCATDSSMLVKNNFIDTFNKILADGGAVYLGGNGSYPMIITGNIAINGTGNCFGTTDTTASGSRGIYLDDHCANMEVSYNTCANIGSFGIMIHNSSSINIHHNTVYNSIGAQILFSNNANHPAMTGNVTQNNIFISKTSSQPTMWIASQYSNIETIGTFNYNFYARPTDDNKTIKLSPGFASKYLTLDEWKTFSNQDPDSKKSPKSVHSDTEIAFFYNDTKTSVSVNLPYPGIDVEGVKYSTKATIEPFRSLIIIKDLDTNLDR